MAPKNKTYSGSCSLSNRVCLVVGIHSLGTVNYFTRLYAKLGVTMTDDVLHYLATQQKARSYRIKKSKEREYKKTRNVKLHNRLKEYSEAVKRSIAKRDGSVYHPGIGMDGGYDPQETQPPTAASGVKTCSACGKQGHRLRTHRDCTLYVPRRVKTPPSTATTITSGEDDEEEDDAERDAEELNLLDSVAFDDYDEFFDCFEGDEDDEEGIVCGLI